VERLGAEAPLKPGSRALRVRLALAEGDLDRARSLLEGATLESAALSHARGLWLEGQGRWREAARVYREALERGLFRD